MEDYTSKTPTSRALYQRAKNVLPAGVSYGVRYFGPYPFFTARAIGSKLYDVDGNEYVDFWLGHTALILGHSPRPVVMAVKKQLENGTIYGTSHELEVALAEQVVKMVPSAQMVRFTNSGTEANMYATRLARALTARDKIAKFLGGWHGGYDALHVGVKPPFDVPESAGLTRGALQDTILLPFNDLDGVEHALKNEQPASIIIEPVLGAGGGISVEKEFLKGLREFCDRKDILLIFDEVITGFRLAPGGGQEYFGVKPDITVLGKILGGGFPIGALCASKKIMEKMDSTAYKRPNYSFQGGTFVGNPITMTAGLTTLRLLEDGEVTNRLNGLGDGLRTEMKRIFDKNAIDAQITGAGSLFNIHFTKEPVKDPQTASRADIKRMFNYNLAMIADGVFFLPTHTCAWCTAHSKEDLHKLLRETEAYARECRQG
ncbi:MAG TPA: aspartate aminotransferase family protein [Candidatus Eisenbacteria bacterium]|nr:aspartate aminotransferase family protein [Candidatus Eisenbacteria bacterium]